MEAVAYAVVHDDPPRVFLANDIDVLHRVLAFEVVARVNPDSLGPSRGDTVRQALLEERWGDAVVEWIHHTGTPIDVYTHLNVYGDEDLPADLIGAQLQFTRLFGG